jgi:hypothetical protein
MVLLGDGTFYMHWIFAETELEKYIENTGTEEVKIRGMWNLRRI